MLPFGFAARRSIKCSGLANKLQTLRPDRQLSSIATLLVQNPGGLPLLKNVDSIHRCDFMTLQTTRYLSQESRPAVSGSDISRFPAENNGNYHRNRKRQQQRQHQHNKKKSAASPPDVSEQRARATTNRILKMGNEAKTSAFTATSNSTIPNKETLQAKVEKEDFWTDADQSMRWWAKQKTAESVIMSFQLLDALADLSGLAQDPSLSAPVLSTKVLNSIVQNWLVLVVAGTARPFTNTNNHTNNKDNGNSIMTPAAMFQKLEDYRTNSKVTSRTRRKLRPDLETYEMVLEALSMNRYSATYKVSGALDISSSTAQKIDSESLVRHLMEQGADEPDLRPDLNTVSQILYGWSRSGQIISTEEIKRVVILLEEIMMQMEEDVQEPKTSRTKTNTTTKVASSSRVVEVFNHALFAIASSHSNKDAARGAEKMLSILRFMEFMASEDPSAADDVHPNVDTYNLVLNGFARAGQGAQAEIVLQSMVQRYIDAQNGIREHGEGEATTSHENSAVKAVKPTPKSFTIVILAFGNSQENRAAEKAEGVLRWQQELNEQLGGPLQDSIPLDTVSFNNVMRAWSWRRSHIAVERCDNLRKEMYELNLKPDHQTFGQSFKALALSNLPEKGRYAVKVWREMEFHGVQANDYTRSYFEKCVTIPSSRGAQHRRIKKSSP